MIFKLDLRPVLCAIAITMMMLNLFDMNPARASSEHCPAAHAGYADGHGHRTDLPKSCCDAMHCCPMLPCLPEPGLPTAIRHQHHSVLEVEQPLLLVTSIDPPPRSVFL